MPRRASEKLAVTKKPTGKKRGRPRLSEAPKKSDIDEAEIETSIVASQEFVASQEVIASQEVVASQDVVASQEIVASQKIVEDPEETPVFDEQKDETTKTIEKQRIRGPEEASNSEPPSCFIHVSNLVRPFTITDLQFFLSSVGKFDENNFWIDNIKSNCYVKYEDIETATNAIRLYNGVQWPEHNPKRLAAGFANLKTMKANTSGIFSGNDIPVPPSTPRKTVIPKLLNASGKPASKPLYLRELFNKTTCEPCIYWCPVSAQKEEESCVNGDSKTPENETSGIENLIDTK